MSRWSADAGVPVGSILSVDQCWELALRWYEGRHRPEWERKSAPEMEAIFREVGLQRQDPAFWSLATR